MSQGSERAESAYLRSDIRRPKSDIAGEPARLELRGVSAGYNGALALSDVSFQVPHGARVAIVGPNGSGKSNIADALRLWRPRAVAARRRGAGG